MNIQWHYAFQIIKERTQYLQWVTENILATYTSSVKDESKANPPAHGLSSAANPGRNRYHSRPLGIVLMPMLEHHPNRPLSDFRRILVLIFHDSILSQIEVSDNTGAVHDSE